MNAGTFVRASVNELGTGTLLETERGIALVEYFESTGRSHRACIAASALEPVTPPSGTRCYWQDARGWRSGRLRDVAGATSTVVERGSARQLPTGAIRVRWAPPIAAGTLVRVLDSADGVGRLIGADAETARVEYFVSPVGPRLERREVPATDLEPWELPAQTLIYWHDPARSAWRVGRVTGGLVSAAALRAAEDHYDVRFPNDEDRHVPLSDVYVPWAHPILDPTDLLVARVTESPYFAAGRQRLLKFLASQRAAFGGLTGLAGAAIELHGHQLSVVRRVLTDPVQRYVLADEVGLGKTIEAGILIRQHLVDAPSEARVAVLAPAHLCDQWRTELAVRFALKDDERVTVLAHETLARDHAGTLAGTSLLVIDEAHRLAAGAWEHETGAQARYEIVEALARASPRLLLLTGTPLLHEEDGFLAMLHLLDPEGYPLTDREAFRRRVHARQIVAESIADLGHDAAALFAEEALDRLERTFEDDAVLRDLAQRVRAHLEADPEAAVRQDALRTLRSYVVETYRLHRRLLRTRRDHRDVAPLLPVRTGVEWVECPDAAREAAAAFLEEWRLALPGSAIASTGGSAAPRVFAEFVDAAYSHPLVLLRCIERHLRAQSGAGLDSAHAPAFDGEDDFLARWCDALRATLQEEPRVSALHAWLRHQASPRAIVFVDDPEVADRVGTLLRELHPAVDVVRYAAGSGAIERFQAAKASVLVCDRGAEEGLNLQAARAAVVFYDVPLEAGRLEQRLGRVDRLEGMQRVRAVAFRAVGPYEEQWLACLVDPIRIFHRSVAPLQFILAEAGRRIRASLVVTGPDAIAAEGRSLRSASTGVEAELRRIRAQESLDALEWDATAERGFIERVQHGGEVAASAGADALGAWLERCVMYRRRGSEVLHYVHLLGGRHPTLVPLAETLERFAEFGDESVQERPDELPLGPFTYAVDAARDGVALLRVGHPFVDRLEAMVRADPRGRAWVFWRHTPGMRLDEAQLFFGFHFVLETDLRHAAAVVDAARTDGPALRRLADATFRPAYVPVWVRADGVVESRPSMLATLGHPYAARKEGGHDTHIRAERWGDFETHVALGDWEDRCALARQNAEDWVRRQLAGRCTRAAERARTAFAARERIWRSRLQRLDGQAHAAEEAALAYERTLTGALVAGTEYPAAHVDMVGAVVLASRPFSEERP